jgi:hypothetical protein
MKLNWGKSLIIFFILFFIWVFFFVLFAMRQNIDLVSDDYYQKGARYTDQININKRSVPYQDSIQISATGEQVRIVLAAGLAPAGDSVQVHFYRSSDKTKDLRFSFRKTDSPFLIETTRFVHGRYQVYITWGSGEENYSITKILDIE